MSKQTEGFEKWLNTPSDAAFTPPDHSALLQLLTAASLMRITIKKHSPFLAKTVDWERLENAMKNAERELKKPSL